MTTWSHPFSKRNFASSSESTCEVPYSFFDSFFFRFTTSPERRTTTSCSYVFPSIVIAPNVVLSILIMTSSSAPRSNIQQQGSSTPASSSLKSFADLFRDTPSDVVVEMELVRMRAQPDGIDFPLSLVVEPGL